VNQRWSHWQRATLRLSKPSQSRNFPYGSRRLAQCSKGIPFHFSNSQERDPIPDLVVAHPLKTSAVHSARFGFQKELAPIVVV
jgi:hypothetical protein